MILDLSSLQNAISQLEDALDIFASDLAEKNPRLKRHLRAAVIQAFEFTYELSFKMLKRHLALTSTNPKEFDYMYFDDVVREAFRQSLVQAEISVWRDFRRNRGITSQTYDEEKANEVLRSVPAFLIEARYLLKQLQNKAKSID